MWTSVANVKELERGALKKIVMGNIVLVVYLENDSSALAFDATCPHKGGPLALGEINDRRIRCPWHGYEFSLSNGLPVKIPYDQKYGKWRNTGNLGVYKTRISEGVIFVDI